MNSILKRASGIVLAAIIVFSAVPPRPAHALFGLGDIVIDPTNLVQNTLTAVKSVTGCDIKECALDPLAWSIAKMAVQSMTRSVVTWINSGFNGSPAFVGNLDLYLSNIGDVAAGGFITQLLNNPAIKSPFQTVVGTLAQINYLRSSAANGYFLQNPYTLNQYTQNDTAFINGTSFDGGLHAWLAMTTQSQNNPYGAQMLAQQELQRRISSAQSNAVRQLDWGQGFLSWCNTSAAPASAKQDSTVAAQTVQIEGGGSLDIPSYQNPDIQISNAAASINTSAPNNSQTCTNSDGTSGTVSTPGSVIQAQLNKTLGLSGDQLVTADEFNEIIGALMSQMVGQVLGGTGLSGVSQPSSSGSSFLTQATNSSQLTGTSGAIGTAFTSGIQSSQDQITQYQNGWQTIGSEADLALSASKTCPDTTAQPSDVKAQATAAQTKASAAITKLQTFSSQASAATASGSVSGSQTGGTSSGTSLQDVGTAYQSFVASSAMPSASDIAYAAQQSAETGTSTPASLYTQMRHIANGCKP